LKSFLLHLFNFAFNFLLSVFDWKIHQVIVVIFLWAGVSQCARLQFNWVSLWFVFLALFLHRVWPADITDFNLEGIFKLFLVIFKIEICVLSDDTTCTAFYSNFFLICTFDCLCLIFILHFQRLWFSLSGSVDSLHSRFGIYFVLFGVIVAISATSSPWLVIGWSVRRQVI